VPICPLQSPRGFDSNFTLVSEVRSRIRRSIL
jgi:hypothetical protein